MGPLLLTEFSETGIQIIQWINDYIHENIGYGGAFYRKQNKIKTRFNRWEERSQVIYFPCSWSIYMNLYVTYKDLTRMQLTWWGQPDNLYI